MKTLNISSAMGKIEDLPPSYDEAVSQTATGSNSSSNNGRYDQPPPPHPQRPQVHQSSTTQSYSYSTSSHSIPQQQQQQFQQQQQPGVLPTSSVPWKYPRGYWCSKCHNTGRKLKNGKSCQKCWDKFAPRNPTAPNVSVTTNYNSNANSTFGSYRIPFSSSSFNAGFSQPQNYTYTSSTVNNMRPKFVRPGDPAIGGVQCGKCRGSGLVRFFLDEELW